MDWHCDAITLFISHRFRHPARNEHFLDTIRGCRECDHAVKMHPPCYHFLGVAAICLAVTCAAHAASTVPVGYLTINIAAGTGSAYTATPIAIPLTTDLPQDFEGAPSGTLTGVSDNVLTVTDAAWPPDALAQPSTPYLLEITSGTQKGRHLLISANTADSITVHSEDPASGQLTSIGISEGDTFRIIPCDTLASIFGSPSGQDSIAGGPTPDQADQVILQWNGQWKRYFYNTEQGFWADADSPTTDCSHTPIPHGTGLIYNRLPASPLDLVLLGEVPRHDRPLLVPSTGQLFIAQPWPIETTLADLGMENTPGWVAGTGPRNADTILISKRLPHIDQTKTFRNWTTYYFDGNHWRETALGRPISDGQIIDPGSSIQIQRTGMISGNPYSTQIIRPYNLE